MSVTRITTPGYTDQSVTTDKLADNAVTSSKIANNAVGTTEIANDSVTTDKITFENSLVPTGAVFYFASADAPAGYLVCDGSDVPNGTGTIQGKTANFSALRAITGPNLPDLRGEFIRGWDSGRGVDPSRGFGSFQKGTLVAGYDDNSDSGDISLLEAKSSRDYGSDVVNSNIASSLYGMNRVLFRQGGVTIGIYGLAYASDWYSITRPRNIALLPCIKY